MSDEYSPYNSVSLTITLPIQNLWSEVFRSATKGIGLLIPFHVQFTQAKIAQSNMASIVKKDVLGF